MNRVGISFDFILLLPTSLCQEEVLGKAGRARSAPQLRQGPGARSYAQTELSRPGLAGSWAKTPSRNSQVSTRAWSNVTAALHQGWPRAPAAKALGGAGKKLQNLLEQPGLWQSPPFTSLFVPTPCKGFEGAGVKHLVHRHRPSEARFTSRCPGGRGQG